jgi:hypothetical protein
LCPGFELFLGLPLVVGYGKMGMEDKEKIGEEVAA